MSSLGSHTGSMEPSSQAEKLLPKTGPAPYISATTHVCEYETAWLTAGQIWRWARCLGFIRTSQLILCDFTTSLSVYASGSQHWVSSRWSFKQLTAYAFIFRLSMGHTSWVRWWGPATLHNPLQSICVMTPETVLVLPLQHVEGEG